MASSSSSRKPKYDVFLSFRGEDTRPNILSHLRDRLDDERIDTFKDDTEMERGEEIGPSLLEVIESATIALIIVSKGYASSKWCLDELVEIMKRRDSGELIVLPIFDHVDPSDVRNPTTGIFADDFTRHEENYKEKAKLWRKAMAQVGKLSGYHLKNCRHEKNSAEEKLGGPDMAQVAFRSEAELLKEVIADVRKKLKPTQPVCTNRFVGIDSQIEEVKRLLCFDNPDQKVIGIVGMGGIGKTTIATVTFEQIFREFDCTSFPCVEENPRELLARLLSELLNETVTISRPFVGPSCEKILNRLCRKKVLIVLDDVNNSKQLEDLIVQNKSFGAGSRIIVTSRDKQLLRTICSNGDDSIYEVRGLYYSDALKLFCLHAFKKNDPLEEFRNMIEPILGYAGGNPLALKVLGSFLYTKTKSVWEDVLNGLSKCQKQDIRNVLRISYDGLDKMEKKIFLHIACFFGGFEETSSVIELLDSCGLQTRSGLDVLRDKCLLNFEYLVKNWVYVGMHSLLREMGREIVREESDDPGKRSILWDSSDICQVFNKNSGTEAIEAIDLGWEGEDVYINSDAFRKMPNLKFLIFGDPDRVHCLSMELEYLPDELRLLKWYCCPLKRLAINFQPTNLVELFLISSKLEQLWEGIQDLRKLRRIDLESSECLIKLPDLSLASNLVEVNLYGCSSLVDIPSSMNNLNKLEYLDLEGCRDIRSLPSPIAWRSLKALCLRESKLSSFPEIECLDALSELNMSNCIALKSLPSSIWKLKSLEYLKLDGCLNLENLSRSLESPQFSGSQLHTNGQLSPLKLLSISGCEKIQLLPELSGTLLKFLDLSNCKSLETVFDLEQLMRGFESKGSFQFFFCNCWKLDVRWSKIAALAKMKIQAEAMYSYLKGTCYEFEMIYPGCEIPKWIKYQNMGRSITIQLPLSKRFLGFALSAVVPAGDCFFYCNLCFTNSSDDSFNHGFYFRDISFSWEYDEDPNSELRLESEHVILHYAPFESYEYKMVHKLGCSDGYCEVTFDISNCTRDINGPDVLKCGLVPLYAQNINYKGLETPLDESETTKVTINLAEDEFEVSVDGCQLKNLDREDIVRTYKDLSTEILEVDPLTLSSFCGTLYCVWGNERCKEFKAVCTLYPPNERCSVCTDIDYEGDDECDVQKFDQELQDFFQGMNFRAQPNPAQAFNQQQQVDLCTELQLRPCWLK